MLLLGITLEGAARPLARAAWLLVVSFALSALYCLPVLPAPYPACRLACRSGAIPSRDSAACSVAPVSSAGSFPAKVSWTASAAGFASCVSGGSSAHPPGMAGRDRPSSGSHRAGHLVMRCLQGLLMLLVGWARFPLQNAQRANRM